jgi:hypothetical protein
MVKCAALSSDPWWREKQLVKHFPHASGNQSMSHWLLDKISALSAFLLNIELQYSHHHSETEKEIRKSASDNAIYLLREKRIDKRLL